jgi:hypothetical protein
MIAMKRGLWLSPKLSRSTPGWIGTTAATGLPRRVSTQVSLRGRRPYSTSVACLQRWLVEELPGNRFQDSGSLACRERVQMFIGVVSEEDLVGHPESAPLPRRMLLPWVDSGGPARRSSRPERPPVRLGGKCRSRAMSNRRLNIEVATQY